MSEMIKFKNMVEEKALEGSSDVLPNAGKEHAAIVMSKMFSLSKESINMVVGTLKGDICDDEDYLSNLTNAIDRGVSVKVLFVGNPAKESKCFKLLENKINEHKSVEIRYADATTKSELSTSVHNNGNDFHFSTFDNKMYRFEKDTQKYLAWFCFNGKDICGQLNTLFNKSFSTSTSH